MTGVLWKITQATVWLKRKALIVFRGPGGHRAWVVAERGSVGERRRAVDGEDGDRDGGKRGEGGEEEQGKVG